MFHHWVFELARHVHRIEKGIVIITYLFIWHDTAMGGSGRCLLVTIDLISTHSHKCFGEVQKVANCLCYPSRKALVEGMFWMYCFCYFRYSHTFEKAFVTIVLPQKNTKHLNTERKVLFWKQHTPFYYSFLPSPDLYHYAPFRRQVPSERLARAGRTLRTVLLTRAPHMIRDRKFHLRTYRRCMLGGEMVDWMMQQGAFVHSRNQAVGMWQALLEEGVIVHGEGFEHS